MNMISAKKLIKMARKWQKFAVKQRKRISFPRSSNYNDAESCSTSYYVVGKGHFVVYTTDQKRFVVPLSYLQHEVIGQLLHMSEEEFGLPSDGPITLPCNELFMNYIISLIKSGVAADIQNALLVSVASSRCSSVSYNELFLNYIISLIKSGVAADIQNALLVSVASSRCSSVSYLHEQRNPQLLVC